MWGRERREADRQTDRHRGWEAGVGGGWGGEGGEWREERNKHAERLKDTHTEANRNTQRD